MTPTKAKSALAVTAFLALSLPLPAQRQIRPQTFEGSVTLPSAPQPKASISGTVVSETTGQPLAGATVTLSRYFDHILALLSDTGNAPAIPPTTTDDRGRFVFPAIDPAAYNMTVQMSGYVPGMFGQTVEDGRKAALSPAPGQRVEGFIVSLIQSARIEGRIRNSAGEPLGGVPVQIFQPDLKLDQPVVHTTSASDGSYQLEGFLPGSYLLLAGSPADLSWMAPLAVTVSAPRTLNLSIDTRERHAIRGKITMRDTGLPPADASLTVSTVGPPGRGRVVLAGQYVNYHAPTGTFEIPNLLPGIYRITRGCSRADLPVSTTDVTAVELLDGDCR